MAPQILTAVAVEKLVETQSFRPCEIYRDIKFQDCARGLRYIMFDNYYAAFVTVKQGVYIGGEKRYEWSTVLKNKKLMEDPHFESDAQDSHVIDTAEFHKRYDPQNVAILRLFLVQPSPNWLYIDLKNIQCYSDGKDSEDGMISTTAPPPPHLVDNPSIRFIAPLVGDLDGLARGFGDNLLKFRAAAHRSCVERVGETE